MTRQIEFESLFIDTRLVACAHSCKYCLMGKKRIAKISPVRAHALIERFLQWEAADGSDLSVGYTFNYADDHDHEQLELLKDLGTRFPREYDPLKRITLGGLPMRSDDEIQLWLKERQKYGCISVHASLAGTDATHDYWNGQHGNFSLIMRMLRTAGELGMALGARMFVSKSTLPSLARLNDMLDELPQHPGNWRYAVPYFYIGWGARFEDERIDEAIRDSLPPWLQRLSWTTAPDSRALSEREWIKVLSVEDDRPQKVALTLTITEENIGWLETRTCGEIVQNLKARTAAAYASIPSTVELAEQYGDSRNTRIYPLERCVEIKWLDKYLLAKSVVFERHLTHLQIG